MFKLFVAVVVFACCLFIVVVFLLLFFGGDDKCPCFVMMYLESFIDLKSP